MRMIVGAGGRVVGVSNIVGSVYDSEGIDVEELLSSRDTFGDDCVKHYRSLPLRPSSALYLRDADVLVPGARPDSVSDKNIDAIRAKFIVPIANISVSTQMEGLLFERGVSYIPGFVSNSGGIFCWYLARLSEQCREDIIREGYARKVRNLIDDASARKLPVAELARLQAQDNANRMASEGSSFFGRISAAVNKLSPRRLAYVALSKVLGGEWSRNNTVFCRRYFDAKYFR